MHKDEKKKKYSKDIDVKEMYPVICLIYDTKIFIKRKKTIRKLKLFYSSKLLSSMNIVLASN